MLPVIRMALLLCHVRSSIDDSRVLDLGAMGGATPPERSRRLRTGNPGLGLEKHPFVMDVHPLSLKCALRVEPE